MLPSNASATSLNRLKYFWMIMASNNSLLVFPASFHFSPECWKASLMSLALGCCFRPLCMSGSVFCTVAMTQLNAAFFICTNYFLCCSLYYSNCGLLLILLLQLHNSLPPHIQLASNQVWGIWGFSFHDLILMSDNMLASSFHTSDSLNISVRFDRALFIFCFWFLGFALLDYWVFNFFFKYFLVYYLFF